MLTRTITYNDFNDNATTETLYFHLAKTEMLDLLHLQPRIEKWQGINADDMTNNDTLEFFNILKELVDASYGIRSEDGKHFSKTIANLEYFKSSAGYDALLFGFIDDPDSALQFLMDIIPKGLADDAIVEARKSLTNAPLPNESVIAAVEEEVPAWIREDREMTPTEARTASKDQLVQAMQRRSARG